VQRLLKCSSVSLQGIVAKDPVLDIGAADGALSFFWESLGSRVHAVDFSGYNINRMQGLRRLAAHFGSKVEMETRLTTSSYHVRDRWFW
jgi:2-polyprenyl-3-methyl-5-hydroxy-6-metoxy-1,4-benzoquinol methylase